MTAPALTPEQEKMWRATIELAALLPRPWTIVGGQMAHLHAWERGVRGSRPTRDIDAGLGFRATPDIGVAATRTLQEAGFHPATTSTDGPQVRWLRGDLQVDVLIPVGSRQERHDINGDRLLESHGIQQALDRSEDIELVVGGIRGPIPRPRLFAGIVAKAASLRNHGDSRADRHLEDLAAMLPMLRPDDLDRETMTRRDMEHLGLARLKLTDARSRWNSPGVANGFNLIRTAWDHQ